MSDGRNEAGRLFQTLGPATWKALSPKWRNPSECEGPHTWRHETNGADGGRHPRQVGSRRTSSEALNHVATCIRAEPT